MLINTMGGICSRSGRSTVEDLTVDNAPRGSFPHANGHSNNGAGVVFPSKINGHLNPSPVDESVDKQLRGPFSYQNTNVVTYTQDPDDINDGIPQLSRVLSHKSRSTKSKQAAVAKVSLIRSLHVFAL